MNAATLCGFDSFDSLRTSFADILTIAIGSLTTRWSGPGQGGEFG